MIDVIIWVICFLLFIILIAYNANYLLELFYGGWK